MPECDWSAELRRFVEESRVAFERGDLLPQAPQKSLVAGFGAGAIEVWRHYLSSREPFHLFEPSGDLARRYIAVSLALDVLALDSSQVVECLAKHLIGGATGDDIFDAIRWNLAEVRRRVLADANALLATMPPGDIAHRAFLEWEILAAFLAASWGRLTNLLDKYGSVSGVPAEVADLLAARLLFHSLTPCPLEPRADEVGRFDRMTGAMSALLSARQQGRDHEPWSTFSLVESRAADRSEAISVTTEHDLMLDPQIRHQMFCDALALPEGVGIEESHRMLAERLVAAQRRDLDVEFTAVCADARDQWLGRARIAEIRFRAAWRRQELPASDIDSIAWICFAVGVRLAARGDDPREQYREAYKWFTEGAKIASGGAELVAGTWLDEALRLQYRVAALRGAGDTDDALALVEAEIHRLHAGNFDPPAHVVELAAALHDDRGDFDKATDALVSAIQLKPVEARSWHERLMLQDRLSAPVAFTTAELRRVPTGERARARHAAQRLFPLERLAANTREYVVDGVLAESVPALSRRVALTQWALAVESELLAKIFVPFRGQDLRTRIQDRDWTFDGWVEGRHALAPALGQMAECLKDGHRPHQRRLRAWVGARCSALLDFERMRALSRLAARRNDAAHPKQLKDSDAEVAIADARALLAVVAEVRD